MNTSAAPYLTDRTSHTPPSPSHTHHVPHLLNSVEELVVKYRPPSEDRLTSAPAGSPESSPYHIDASNRDSPWPHWTGPPQTMLPFVKTESATGIVLVGIIFNEGSVEGVIFLNFTMPAIG